MADGLNGVTSVGGNSRQKISGGLRIYDTHRGVNFQYLQDEKKPMDIRKPHPNIPTFIFIACGIWLIGLGLYFMFLRPPLLAEDLRYMGTSTGEVQSAVTGLERWLRRVFTVMGGFMTGAGVLTISAAVRASAGQEKWTQISLA